MQWKGEKVKSTLSLIYKFWSNIQKYKKQWISIALFHQLKQFFVTMLEEEKNSYQLKQMLEF